MTEEAPQTAATWEDPSTLVPWEGNPRVNDHAVPDVAKSLLRFGWGSPLVARLEDRMLIAGHTRLKAHALLMRPQEEVAEALGLEVGDPMLDRLPFDSRVPVRVIDISEKEAQVFALADNKTAQVAFWDDGALSDIFTSLGEQETLFGTSFEQSEVNFLLGQWEDPFHPEDDTAPTEIEDDGTARITVKVVNTAAATVHEVLREGLEAAGIQYTVVSS